MRKYQIIFIYATLGITLLFGDEAIGYFQFKRLCETEGIEGADLSKAKGHSVVAIYSERQMRHGTILPVKQSTLSFIDASTKEELISAKEFYSLGGWLKRFTWVGLGSSTPIFEGNGCGLKRRENIFLKNSITEIEQTK